jgi:serine/threonine protein kinase
MLGERVAGKYELRRLLGAGSMGAVYEVRHVDLGKRLAIKLIRPEFCESTEIVARFRREARAASAVESDYIVQILDFGRDEALGLYMVLEYLEGEDLEARLVREKWIEAREAATLGLQVARGLAKAHAAGIIHRDLKPANVFLTRRDDGSVLAKILDFGISKIEPASSRGGDAPEATLTAYGTTLGTPQYMSPEQCEGKVALDGRTDVWALCAVLYEMLAGEPAIEDAGGHVATMARIVHEDVVPLAARAPWVPEKLARDVDAGRARRREDRILDAATLAARLVEACPEAAARPGLAPAMRPTDASELAPACAEGAEAFDGAADAGAPDDAPPATLADPLARLQANAPPTVPAAAPATSFLADTAHPPSSDAPSSEGDKVEVFVRAGDLPSEVIALREEKKRKT